MAKKVVRKRPTVTTTKKASTKFRQWEQGDTSGTATLADNEMAAGFLQHPETGLYQTWISTNGLDVNFVSVHQDQQGALDALALFAREVTAGRAAGAAQAMSAGGQADVEPADVDYQTVEKIAADVADRRDVMIVRW